MFDAKRTTLALLAATFLAAGATPALAEGDIYSRLMSMKMMDKNHDGMISRQDFLDMVGKVWDAHREAMNLKGNKMSIEHLKEIQKVLGRDIGVRLTCPQGQLDALRPGHSPDGFAGFVG